MQAINIAHGLHMQAIITENLGFRKIRPAKKKRRVFKEQKRNDKKKFPDMSEIYEH